MFAREPTGSPSVATIEPGRSRRWGSSMTASQTNLDRSPLPRLQDEVVDILNEHAGT